MTKRLIRRTFLLGVAFTFNYGFLANPSPAQTTETEVRSGNVVYVAGNDLVVKMDNGEVRHFVVPEGGIFHVGGKELTVHELKPGTHLSQTITTTSTPRIVTTVRTIKGKVWQVNAPHVILTLPNGTNKQYKVPDGTKFNIGDETKTVFDLRKGMNVAATIVTETPEVVVTRNARVTGTAPAPVQAALPRPATPPTAGPILIEEVVVTAPEPQQSAAVTAPEATRSRELPKTGSSLPLIGLLGLLNLSAGLGLRALGRARHS